MSKTIGGYEVGKRIDELHLDGVTVVEKPDSSEYYPDYHEIFLLSHYGMAERYGVNWKEKHDKLSLRVDRELCEWITNSGIPHDLVFDLHDNTPPEKYRKLMDQFARSEGVGFITKHGYLAVGLPFFQVGYFFKEEPDCIDDVIGSFKPKAYVPTEIVKHYPDDVFFSDYIGIEFHPAKIVGLGGIGDRIGITGGERVRTYSKNDGAKAIVQFIEYLRKSLY